MYFQQFYVEKLKTYQLSTVINAENVENSVETVEKAV